MVSKNKGIYGFFGQSWILIALAPRNINKSWSTYPNTGKSDHSTHMRRKASFTSILLNKMRARGAGGRPRCRIRPIMSRSTWPSLQAGGDEKSVSVLTPGADVEKVKSLDNSDLERGKPSLPGVTPAGRVSDQQLPAEKQTRGRAAGCWLSWRPRCLHTGPPNHGYHTVRRRLSPRHRLPLPVPRKIRLVRTS